MKTAIFNQPKPVSGVCRSAFTLIELLVVISIIALLISILLPTLKGAREAGRTVACLSNMRQLGIAQHAYAHDFDGIFAHAWSTDLSVTPNGAPYWGTLLKELEYISTFKVLSSPSDTLERPNFSVFPQSYGLNWLFLQGPDFNVGATQRLSTLDGVKVSRSLFGYVVPPQSAPSTLIMAGEQWHDWNGVVGNATEGFAGSTVVGFLAAPPFVNRPWTNDGHNNAGNYLFFDGHASTINMRDEEIKKESAVGAQDFGVYWGGL